VINPHLGGARLGVAAHGQVRSGCVRSLPWPSSSAFSRPQRYEDPQMARSCTTWRLFARDVCRSSSEVQTRRLWQHGKPAHSSSTYAVESHQKFRMSTLESTGQWPASEIDYTTGCTAQRANWPASVHWSRISELDHVVIGKCSYESISCNGRSV
jgi:hypothetical protein